MKTWATVPPIFLDLATHQEQLKRKPSSLARCRRNNCIFFVATTLTNTFFIASIWNNFFYSLLFYIGSIWNNLLSLTHGKKSFSQQKYVMDEADGLYTLCRKKVNENKTEVYFEWTFLFFLFSARKIGWNSFGRKNRTKMKSQLPIRPPHPGRLE